MLHQKNTLVPKICEINARFTTNGFLITQYGCQAINECKQLDNLKKINSLKSISQINQITSFFEKRFDLKRPIGILLGREVIKSPKLFFL